MRTCILLIMLLLLPTFGYAETEVKHFKVKYIIIYNSMSLADAADKEMEIKKRYEKACTVDVEVEKTTGLVGTVICFDSN